MMCEEVRVKTEVEVDDTHDEPMAFDIDMLLLLCLLLLFLLFLFPPLQYLQHIRPRRLGH